MSKANFIIGQLDFACQVQFVADYGIFSNMSSVCHRLWNSTKYEENWALTATVHKFV